MDFVELVFFHATILPEKAAIVLRDRGVNYAKLADAVRTGESRLRALGLKPGELVGIGTENPIRHLTLVMALYRAGMPSVSLRHGFDLSRSGLRLAAVLRDEAAAPTAGARDVALDEGWFSGSPVAAPVAAGFPSGDALCRVSLSSGTTGFPKAVAFTVDDIEARLRTYILRAANTAWDRLICLPGLTTNFGFSFALVALAQGKSLLAAASARETLEMIPRYAVDLMVASTQQLRDLVEAQTAAPVALGSLRAVHVGGNVMSQAFLETARTRICPRIICAYGSTEAGTVAHAPSEMLQGIEGAVGFVAPWAEVETVDDTGNALPRGQTGVIRMRTEGQGRTYAADGEGKNANFRGGWFYPGDRGMVTERGMMVVVGRTHELINAGGAKVAPELIEDVLLARPDVKDAAALAMTGTSGIEELWVAIVPSGAPPAPAEIVAYCGQKNADYRPAQIRFVAAIPRSALGKVARDQLRQQLACS
ncbi:MAG TPA: long-chain fatty acid--CoA ligase [Stellaceae bacterium]|nr:long-chain fatty acid--CoA ligase [Stellaceae bacterium]